MRKKARFAFLVGAVLLAAMPIACGGSEGGGPSSLGDGTRPAASSAEATCRDVFVAICAYYDRCAGQAVALCEAAGDWGREMCEAYVEQYLAQVCNDPKELCDDAEIQGVDQSRIRSLINCVNLISCSTDPARACGDESVPINLEF